MTASKDDIAGLPVDTRVVALKPVMSEVYVLCSEVGDGEVDVFPVFPDGHPEFSDFGDVSAFILGSIGIIDGNRGGHFLGFKLVFLYVGMVDCASGTPAVYKCLCHQCLGPSA